MTQFELLKIAFEFGDPLVFQCTPRTIRCRPTQDMELPVLCAKNKRDERSRFAISHFHTITCKSARHSHAPLVEAPLLLSLEVFSAELRQWAFFQRALVSLSETLHAGQHAIRNEARHTDVNHTPSNAEQRRS
jgi:hypothetical protein